MLRSFRTIGRSGLRSACRRLHTSGRDASADVPHKPFRVYGLLVAAAVGMYTLLVATVVPEVIDAKFPNFRKQIAAAKSISLTHVAVAVADDPTPVVVIANAEPSPPSPASPTPKPAQSTTSPSIAVATFANDKTIDDDDNDDAVADAAFEAEWERRHANEREFSAPANKFPSRPHVSSLVAVDIPTRIDQRESDILLQIYAPWCGACKMQQPVVDTTAKVLNTVQAQQTKSTDPSLAVTATDAASSSPTADVRVFVMDGEANVLPGFLSVSENRALPLLKYFPRCGSKRYPDSIRSLPACQPVVYDGECNVEHLLEFVHRKVSDQSNIAELQQSTPFDLAAAHEIARAEEPATRERVAQAIVARMNKDFGDMPSQRLYELVPCGNMLTNVLQQFMASSYRSYSTPGEVELKGQELFEQMRVCQEKEKKRITQFWEQVKTQAEEALASQKEEKEAESKP